MRRELIFIRCAEAINVASTSHTWISNPASFRNPHYIKVETLLIWFHCWLVIHSSKFRQIAKNNTVVSARLFLDLAFSILLFPSESESKKKQQHTIPFFSLKMDFVVAFALLCLFTMEPWRVLSQQQQRLLVNMTLVPNARASGARKFSFIFLVWLLINTFVLLLLFIKSWRVGNIL